MIQALKTLALSQSILAFSCCGFGSGSAQVGSTSSMDPDPDLMDIKPPATRAPSIAQQDKTIMDPNPRSAFMIRIRI